jgi:hypothetical protein
MRTLALTLTFAAGMTAAAGAQAQQPQESFVTIGTGGVTGVYYPAGGAICRLLNRNRDQHGIRCSVESTEGSIFNLNALRDGEIDFGVVQSDWQYHASQGSDRFEGNAIEDLRSVFALHAEPFTVVARQDSGIETFEDLQGKRVNVGPPGSGARGTMEVLMDAYGWSMDDFSLAAELSPNEQAQALCDNNVDAIVFAVGHPSGTIQEATTACPSVLVDVTGDVVEKLISENPYYAEATIPGGMYQGNPEPTDTFGVRATIVSTADVPGDTVYELTKAVFENLDDFKRLHPAFQELTREEMVSRGVTAQLHEGSQRYFEEANLMDAVQADAPQGGQTQQDGQAPQGEQTQQ